MNKLKDEQDGRVLILRIAADYRFKHKYDELLSRDKML
jgi:hypothetical protein